jgi:hypothetical protein
MKQILFALALLSPVLAQPAEDFSQWQILTQDLNSTTGKAKISGYVPKVMGKMCSTDFTTTEEDGRISYNIAEFDAVEMQGGILCMNGKFRAKDGSASGTTPLRVFIKDGVQRRSP